VTAYVAGNGLTGRVTCVTIKSIYFCNFQPAAAALALLCEAEMKCVGVLALSLVCVVPAAAGGQTSQAPAVTQPAPAPDAPSDPDIRVQALQPDFNLATLPTTLRMPVHKWAFRVTHRFSRPLGEGDFGDLLSNMFGLDSGAQIGLELRYGLLPGTQIGIHRTNDRTIQLFGQHNFLTQRDGGPLGLDALATFEGTENLQEKHQSALGFVLSRNAGRWAALYAEPIAVVNSNLSTTGDTSTLMVGFGARVRVRPSTYLVAEITPRVAGYDPGVSQISFGLEGRAGGHLFQLNVSNGFATTLGQISRGGFSNDNWYIGFNIARKFF
jgi:hypothetical protein